MRADNKEVPGSTDGRLAAGSGGSATSAPVPVDSAAARHAGEAHGGAGSGARARVAAFAALLTAATGCLLWLARLEGYAAPRTIADPLVLFAGLVVLFTGAELAPVSFHYRGETYLVDLTETPLLLGLAFASPLVVVLSAVAADAIVFGFARRQGALKLFFNLALISFGSATAAVVYHLCLHGSSPVAPFGIAGGIAALATADLTGHFAVRIVTRLHGQEVRRSTGFESFTFAMLMVAGIGLAFVVLDAAWWNWWAVLPLALVGALIVVSYRGYVRLTQRFSALQRLYDFSHALASNELEPAATAAAVLEQVQAVMGSKRAGLLLVDGSGSCQLTHRRGSSLTRTPVESLDDGSVLAQVMRTSEAALLLNQGRLQPGTGRDPVLGDFGDAVVAPLVQGERVVGVLSALDRDEALNPFDEDDRRLLEALAANALSSLERARLLEELRLEAESKLYQASYDSLTGLPNRTLLLAKVAEVLEGNHPAAVILLDIDRFKDVNDTLGHETGDRMLCRVAERLVGAARSRATVARLGGDEFAVMVPDVMGPEEALGVVRDLERALSGVIDVDGLSLAVRASAGVVLAPEHGDNVVALLQRADIAMYSAKERKSGVELYSPSSDQSSQRRLMLGGELLRALETKSQLSLVYQPIADLATGEVTRVETLCRWTHPVHGAINPAEFVRIAEQIGLIGQLTDFVLSRSCAQAAEWRQKGLKVGLAVNLSGRELSDEHLVERILRHLEESKLPPSDLTLELTETEVMSDLDAASDVLGSLAGLGIQLAVDDYGTGYSSLAYLHRLPVQELKIDRSFVKDIAEDASNRIIVRSSVAMAHSLGLGVVAEGAEDELTCAILAETGCDSLQGYFLSRPKKPGELEEWLASGGRLEFTREQPGLFGLQVHPSAGRRIAGGVGA